MNQTDNRANRQQVETIIQARWVIPVQPEGVIIDDGCVVVDQGRILAVGSQAECAQKYYSENVIDRSHHVLIPGLINAHTHAAMSLLRGYADDLPLMNWLQNHIWPAETKWVDESFMQVGTELAIAEMIQGGTTCFNDMYFFPDVVAKVAQKAGIRASVGMIVIDSPTIWAQKTDEYIRKGLEVHDAFRHDPLVQTAFAPHAPYTVPDEALKRISMLADELDVQIHMHVHETEFEVMSSVAQHGVRPLERLEHLGLLTPRLQAVHMTQLLPGEMDVVAECGVSVVYCPESNMKLASGAAPIDKLIDAGVNIALGTDGASSNNNLDMLGEMQSAALLAKNQSGDASALPAAKALRAATLGGANALGIGAEVGSIEVGKVADLVAVDLMKPATWPVYSPLSHLVYSASRDQVSDVWVNGKRLLVEGRLTGINLPELMQKSALWGAKIGSH